MIRIKINNIEFLVNSNISVLEACQLVGIHVPRFCYHETLSIAGNCRMCLVEIEKSPKPVASCALPLSNNISVYTDSPLVKKARENILESLLLNHPLDCPICDQGGECDLQDQTKIYGGDYSRFYINKKVVESKPYGSLIKTIMTRCIHCTRCVRFSEEIAGTSSFGLFHRGKNTEIGPYVLNIFDSEISANVVDLCPVGALTLKPYGFKARPWELKYYESVDCTSSLCSPILISVKESNIVRIQPKIDFKLNNTLITDKIRFFYDSLKKNRIQQVFKKDINTKFSTVEWSFFINEVNTLIKKKKKITFLINENLDFESVTVLKNIESTNIKVFNMSNRNIQKLNNNDFAFYDKTTIIDEKIHTCFLISTNLKIETTLLNTKLRLKYNKSVISTINAGSFYKSNYPQKFICLSLENIIRLFEGKFSNSNNLIEKSGILLIIGNAFNNKITSLNSFSNLFKKVCPRGFILKNPVYPNSAGFDFLNVNGLQNNFIKSTEFFFCINLEDNILTQKLIHNKKFFWFNTHGSNLATKAQFILPTLSFIENENVYVNSDYQVKKSYKILPALKDSKSFFSVIKIILNDIKKQINIQNYLAFLNNLNQNKKFKQNFISIDNKIDLISAHPNKNILENTYSDSILTKNSDILSKRVQEQQKNSHFIF